jgi:methyl-accepting chemotaxis protein
MPRLRVFRGSIAHRLGRVNMVASASALLLAGAALSVYDFVAFRQALIEKQSVEAQIVGANTVTALTFDDTAAAERTLGALRAEPHVEGAALYRPDGQLFASYRREDIRGTLELPREAGRRQEWAQFDGLRTLHLARPVVLDRAAIGIVYIRSDLGDAVDRLVGYGFIVGAVLLVALAASQLVSRVSRRAIAEPLTELAALATKFSADHDYSVRAQVSGSGELQMLIRAFNAPSKRATTCSSSACASVPRRSTRRTRSWRRSAIRCPTTCARRCARSTGSARHCSRTPRGSSTETPPGT